MRIAHISDLHIARPPAMNDYNAKRLLGYVNYRLFRSRHYKEQVAAHAIAELMKDPPELVLFTGDITQHGLDTEFEAARELLSPFPDNNIPVIAIPGNHDIYGRTDNPALEALLAHLARPLRPDDAGVYRFPGVEILPLYQSIPTPPFFSHGRQNQEELERVRRIWTDDSEKVMRLVLGHYPVIDSHGGRLLYFRGLRESDMLIEFCRVHRVSGYFCGHNHKRYVVPMPDGCQQYAAPALSSVREAEKEWVSVYECSPELPHPLDVHKTL